MFTLNPLPAPVDADALARLVRCETATIGHFRHEGFMAPEIRAVVPEKRVVGTAVTLRIAGPDSALLHHVIGHLRPGDFLVIDRCGDRKHAAWGGVVTFAAHTQGLAGAAVDGYGTDFSEIRNLGFPLWCLGPTPITTKKLAFGGAFNVPVSCGGVAVRPGDAVLADESGVLVLPADAVGPVAEHALALQERAPKTLERLRRGEKLGDISGASRLVEEALAKQEG